MANIKQQKKRIGLAERQRLRNRHATSTIKTLFKKLDASVAAKDAEGARTFATTLTRRIDQAAAKGILHRNNAAHKKRRLARSLARL